MTPPVMKGPSQPSLLGATDVAPLQRRARTRGSTTSSARASMDVGGVSRHLLRRVGAERRARLGDRRLQRLGRSARRRSRRAARRASGKASSPASATATSTSIASGRATTATRRQGRPFALAPGDAAARPASDRVGPRGYEWNDDGVDEASAHKRNALDAPHVDLRSALGSWMRVPEDGNRSLSYRELAPRWPSTSRRSASRTSSSCRSWSIRSSARGAIRSPATSRRPAATARRRTSCTSIDYAASATASA